MMCHGWSGGACMDDRFGHMLPPASPSRAHQYGPSCQSRRKLVASLHQWQSLTLPRNSSATPRGKPVLPNHVPGNSHALSRPRRSKKGQSHACAPTALPNPTRPPQTPNTQTNVSDRLRSQTDGIGSPVRAAQHGSRALRCAAFTRVHSSPQHQVVNYCC